MSTLPFSNFFLQQIKITVKIKSAETVEFVWMFFSHKQISGKEIYFY